MRSVRYIGRSSNGEAGVFDDTVLFDDAATARTIAVEIESAEMAFIDDPLSFPWDFLTSTPTAPLVIDVGLCTSDQLAALAPALIHLTRYDTVIARTGSSDRANHFAHLLGARSEEPATSELAELREKKHLHCVEEKILSRLGQDWQTLVVDFTDLLGTSLSSTTWRDPLDDRDAAVVVRLPGEEIRQRGGLASLAAELVATVAGSTVLDVWGVRSRPGDPLSRGLVVIGVDW